MAVTQVEESVVVHADADNVYDVVSDPGNYATWSPEATGVKRLSGEGAYRVGDTFRGRNHIWFTWSTDCTVVVAERPRHFAFKVSYARVPIARWEYLLEPGPDGTTRVTERWSDLRSGIPGVIVKAAAASVGRGFDAATRNRSTMATTLDALRAQLERTNS